MHRYFVSYHFVGGEDGATWGFGHAEIHTKDIITGLSDITSIVDGMKKQTKFTAIAIISYTLFPEAK